jgi:CBS domain-containing protein
MAALFVRHVPVTDHGQIVGILSARDLLDALIERRPAVP